MFNEDKYQDTINRNIGWGIVQCVVLFIIFIVCLFFLTGCASVQFEKKLEYGKWIKTTTPLIENRISNSLPYQPSKLIKYEDFAELK